MSEVKDKYKSLLDELVAELKDDDRVFGDHSIKQLCQSVFIQLKNANLCITFENVEPEDYSESELIEIASSCIRLVYQKRFPKETI